MSGGREHLTATLGKGDADECLQAVQSWLLVSVRHFLQTKQGLQTWVELAENYWRQFVWSPYHTAADHRPPA